MTRYTDEFRAGAVLMLQGADYPKVKGSLERVAKELKVPAMTLHRWFHKKSNPPPNEIVSIKKEQIISMMMGEVYHALTEMGNARQDADYKELATAIGILTDKLQLLTGQPTERTVVVNELSPDEKRSRVATLLERARVRRDGELPLQ